MFWVLLSSAFIAFGFSPPTATLAFADENGLPQDVLTLMNDGLRSYQASNFEEARNLLQKAIELRPNNASILYNLGLSEYKLGKIGRAVGLWRKALDLDPGFKEAEKALEFGRSQNRLGDSNFDPSLFENFRRSVLVQVPLDLSLFVSTALLIVSGWIFLRFRQARRSYFAKGAGGSTSVWDQLDVDKVPRLARLQKILLSLTLLVLVITSLKAWDFTSPRGIVTEPSVAVRSGPNVDFAELFDVKEGSEVILRSRVEGWTQVETLNGRAGWVPETSVFQFMGLAL